jgi:hypothetical protein
MNRSGSPRPYLSMLSAVSFAEIRLYMAMMISDTWRLCPAPSSGIFTSTSIYIIGLFHLALCFYVIIFFISFILNFKPVEICRGML